MRWKNRPAGTHREGIVPDDQRARAGLAGRGQILTAPPQSAPPVPAAAG